MNFPMKIYLCLCSVGGFACYVNRMRGGEWRDKMKKVGLSGLTVSVTTHLHCSCSAANTWKRRNTRAPAHSSLVQ